MHLGDGDLRPLCSRPRFVPPMCRRFEIPTTPMPSARNTAPLRRSTESTTSRIARAVVGSYARSWPFGGRKGRSTPGTSRSPDRSRFGNPGAMMFKDTGSTPATFSRKRFPNKLPRRWAASSASADSVGPSLATIADACSRGLSIPGDRAIVGLFVWSRPHERWQDDVGAVARLALGAVARLSWLLLLRAHLSRGAVQPVRPPSNQY